VTGSPAHLPRVRTLLGVWAHPDDEAYLSSALMAAVRRTGARVVVVTATHGEHGTDDPARWPPDRLAAERERELRASLDVVGVTEHHWLDHRDGELAGVPTLQGARELVPFFDRLAPDTVITFGPDGMTGHDDHRAVSGWTTRAVEGSGAELWYAALTADWLDEWGGLCAETGVWMTGPPQPATDPVYVSRLAGELLDAKIAALAAHRSQTAGLIALVGEERYRSWWSTETFVVARTARAALEEEEAA